MKINLVAITLAGMAGWIGSFPGPAQGSSPTAKAPVAATDTLPDVQIQSLEDQVRATEEAFAQTMAHRDHRAFSEFLSEEAIFFNGSSPIRGKQAVAEAWKPYFEGPEAPFSWEPDGIQVLDSGTLAISFGPVRDPRGTIVGTFNSIWRLDDDGRWRIVFDKGCPVPTP